MALQRDVEQSKVIEHLDLALASAKVLGQDLTAYLIEMALVEARDAFERQPSVMLIRKNEPPKRLF